MTIDPEFHYSIFKKNIAQKFKNHLILINNFSGGVLEPEGIVEIKYRLKDLVKTMRRLDPQLIRLQEQLLDPQLQEAEKSKLEMMLITREKQLQPAYHQIALHFADLHDTPVRMMEKGVIQVTYLK